MWLSSQVANVDKIRQHWSKVLIPLKFLHYAFRETTQRDYRDKVWWLGTIFILILDTTFSWNASNTSPTRLTRSTNRLLVIDLLKRSLDQRIRKSRTSKASITIASLLESASRSLLFHFFTPQMLTIIDLIFKNFINITALNIIDTKNHNIVNHCSQESLHVINGLPLNLLLIVRFIVNTAHVQLERRRENHRGLGPPLRHPLIHARALLRIGNFCHFEFIIFNYSYC